jgi:hypothetical protein
MFKNSAGAYCLRSPSGLELDSLALGKKIKLSLQQAVKAHRVVRRRDSHIF